MNKLVHTVSQIDRIRYDDEFHLFIMIVHDGGNSVCKFAPKRLILQCTDDSMVKRMTKLFATRVGENVWTQYFDIHYDPDTCEIIGEPYVVKDSCTIS